MVQMKIRHVKKTTVKGKTYFYDRISGKRIKAPFGSAAFVNEVEALRKGTPTISPYSAKGTFGGLINDYCKSPEFQGLAPRTQADYNKVFDYLRPMKDLPLSQIDRPFIMAVRDKAVAKRKWHFANYVLACISIVFNWGLPRGYTETNPADKVPKIPRPKKQKQLNRAWTEQELEAVLTAAPEEIKVVLMIAAYTGLRQGDVLSLTWEAYDGEMISWQQGKTGEDITIPVHPILKAVLDDLPQRQATITTNSKGFPYTPSGFRASLRHIITRLLKEEKIKPGLTTHGLRHTVGTRLAEAGADDFTIMSILGHKTTAMAAKYRRDANRKKRAAAAVKML